MTRLQLAAMVTALVATPLTGAWADHRDGAGPYGKMRAEGVVVSVHPHASSFVLRVARPAEPWWTEASYLTVWVQRGTQVDGWEGPAGLLAWLRPGDRVRLDGFRLDDGRVLALEVEVQERALRPPGPGLVVVRGVVVARGPALIVIIDSQGSARIILVVATTQLAGLRTAVDLVQPRDQVVVLGLPNADGTIAARQIQVVGISPRGP